MHFSGFQRGQVAFFKQLAAKQDREWFKEHKDELPRISMALVHDTGTGKVIGLGLQGRQVIQPILKDELVALKDLGVTDINLRGMGGTDHASFEQVGVPGFAVQQDMNEYFLTHHSQSDTLDKAREADLLQGAQVMAVTARRVADLAMLLPRDKPTEKNNDKLPENQKEKAGEQTCGVYLSIHDKGLLFQSFS